MDIKTNPTHIFFFGSKAARSPFELCWKVEDVTEDYPHHENDILPGYCDKNGNVHGYAHLDGTVNHFGSYCIPLQERILVLDTVNQFWGCGETLEQAIAAMPNNMEDLPHTCEVHTGPEGMRINENGALVFPRGGKTELLFCKRDKKFLPGRTLKTAERP